MNHRLPIAVCSAILSFTYGCNQPEIADPSVSDAVINAVIDDSDVQSRTCVDATTYEKYDFVGLLWTSDDAIGVFSDESLNARFNNSAVTPSPKTDFSGSITGSPRYAYYPYTEANNSRSATELSGEVHACQQFDLSTGLLSDDYKIGVPESGSSNRFRFTHLFSLMKIDIDASSTTAEGEMLDKISVSVAGRDGSQRAIAGSFSFDATGSMSPAYYNVGNASSTITMEWIDGPMLERGRNYVGFLTAIPDIHIGDRFDITVVTNIRELSFTVVCRTDFKAGHVYNFPLRLSDYEGKSEYGWSDEPRQDIEYEIVSGKFKCASMNVDGLPSLVNSSGPGANGTKTISQAIALAGWDFFAVSEDFEYDSELCSALGNYAHGTYRGTVGWAQLSSVADTDGLNFFWRNSGFSAANETFIEYTDKEGGLTAGANECIRKGFRHYEVSVADGVVIDVYITHMNTYSGSGNTEDNAYVKAVLSQLRQLRDYVIDNMRKNKRPAIVRGDTNMRYPRHDIKSNLIDVLPEDISFSDPWVDFHRGGVFPTWNTKSLMIQSKFAGDTDSDILCSDDQRGEVVDKIWYFNLKNAETQLSATSLVNNTSADFVKSTSTKTYKGVTVENADGSFTENVTVTISQSEGIADHFPVVADFTWTRRIPK